MLNVVVDLCIAFIQYFSTIVNTHDVHFPDAWKDPMYYVSTINLGFDIFSSAFPSLTDIRLYFTVISVVGPLIFVLLGLMFLVDRIVVLWYFTLLAGVMLLLAGISGSIISATTSISITSKDAQLMLYIGGGLVAFCFISYLITRRWRATVGVVQSRRLIKSEATKEFQVVASLEVFVAGVILIVFALIVSGYVNGVEAASEQVNSVGYKFALGIALAAVIIGGLLILWLMVSFCQAGRLLQWELKEWLQAGFLRILLLSMSLAYIPIGNGVFLMFNCNVFDCPAGRQLLDVGTAIVRNATSEFCVPCLLGPAQACPSAMQASLCAATSSNRLEYDPLVSCENMRQFFWPAAGLMIIAFVLGVPVMFFNLVQLVTSTLHNEFPVKAPAGSESLPQAEREHVMWLKKAGQTQNVAKFLFQPFEYDYRFVRIFQLIQKLAIVGTTTYIVRGSELSPQLISLSCACAIHFIAFLMLSYHRPFLSKFEAGLSIVMALLLTIACVMSILLQRGTVIPYTIYVVVIVLNGIVPIVAIIVGVYLEWHTSKDDDDEKEKEEMLRLQEMVDKKIEEEEASKAAARKAYEDAVEKERLAQEEAKAKAAAEEEERKKAEELQRAAERAAEEKSDNPSQPIDIAVTTPDESPAKRTHVAPLPLGNFLSPGPRSSTPAAGADPMALSMSGGISPFNTPRGVETEEDFNWRKLRRQKLRAEARKKVKNLMDQELLDLNEKQGDVDMLIDRQVKMRLQGFLMGGGVIGSIAFAMCILGLISRDATMTIGTQRTTSVAVELAGYSNWTTFTENCCCLINSNSAAKSSLISIEKWVCSNKRIKERVRSRIVNNATVSGFSVRGMCSTAFAADCTLAQSGTTVSLACTNSRSAAVLDLW
jgi:hypothetical protein